MTPKTSEPLLLDTHVWVWLMNDDVKARASKAMGRVSRAAQEQALLVSWASIWEIGMLDAHRRIVFPMPVLDWVHQALGAPGLSLANLDPEILIESTRLPGNFESDPMDCMLVATARRLSATLVTADRKILRYAERHFVKALAF
jgi:PIN domain nuclease of toxin-antitoxin system